MFHLHNYLRNTGGTLLMTADTPPNRWQVTLPDLASRMQATHIGQIASPDDALLSALIMKLFADRQIMPKPELVTYLTTRIERSFAAAAEIVARLDAAALAQGRKINTALARDLLDNGS
jgi:chromosomal replication initiation ATPase DnaA